MSNKLSNPLQEVQSNILAMETGLAPDAMTDITPAQAINQAYDQFLTGAVNTAVKALEAGRLLAAKRQETDHGEWLPWLSENCPKISERTAQRLIKLANTTHVSDLDGASIRQLYIAAGIISEPEKETPSEPRAESGFWTPLRKAIDYYTDDRLSKVKDNPVVGLGMLRLVKEARAKLEKTEKQLIEWFGDRPYGNNPNG